MMMKSLRWKIVLILFTAHILEWSGVGGQPTPPPTLFEGGYDYAQCAIDVFQSDRNGDGFISRNDEEYLRLIKRIGANFCFTQTTSLTATQQAAYFRLVCELIPDCRFTSEIPVGTLTTTQIIKICEETRASIFTTCPEPTASPVGSVPTPSTPGPPSPTGTIPTPTPPSPTPPSPTPPVVPTPSPPTPGPPTPTPPVPTPTPPTPTPPGSSPAPTQTLEIQAPNVTLTQCLDDVMSSDADMNERITRQEYITFVETFGARVCYEREDSAELSAAEESTFLASICLPFEGAAAACEGLTDILVSQPLFTRTVAQTLCDFTYTLAMNGPNCQAREEPTATETPTTSPAEQGNENPETDPPTDAPLEARNSGARGEGYVIAVVMGTATMLAYAWM